MSWAAGEVAGAELGDVRRQRRLARILEQGAAHPEASVPHASGSWGETKATYDFWQTRGLTPAAILSGHVQATVQRILRAAPPVVLALQDTCALAPVVPRQRVSRLQHNRRRMVASEPEPEPEPEPERTERVQVSALAGAPERRARQRPPRQPVLPVWQHAVLAVSPTGVPYGVLHQEIWRRDRQQGSIVDTRRQRPTAEKESRKWLTAQAATEAVLPAEVAVVTVGDREADVYDLFAQPRRAGADLLIRAAQDRRVEGDHQKLWATVEAAPVAGTLTVPLTRTPERPARTARLTIRFTTLTMRPPVTPSPGSVTAPVTVQAVWAEETTPPPDVPAVSWLLLTTLPVSTFAHARQCLRWYTMRWRIERWHFVLKSGCRLERLALEAPERFDRALATYAIIAWRLLWLTYYAREHPDAPGDLALETHQWQALACFALQTPFPPSSPPSLSTALTWIASLGGFLHCTHDHLPGLQLLWRGLPFLDLLASFFQLFRPFLPHLTSTYG